MNLYLEWLCRKAKGEREKRKKVVKRWKPHISCWISAITGIKIQLCAGICQSSKGFLWETRLKHLLSLRQTSLLYLLCLLKETRLLVKSDKKGTSAATQCAAVKVSDHQGLVQYPMFDSKSFCFALLILRKWRKQSSCFSKIQIWKAHQV